MVQYGIPTRIVKEEVQDVVNGIITTGKGNVFGKYRYFSGIDNPLFYFNNPNYMKQPVAVDPETGSIKPMFRLNLSVHEDTAGLSVFGDIATPELHDFMRMMLNLNGDVDDERYSLTMDSGATFQDGSKDREGKRIHIVFWNSEGAQFFVDYVNKNYKVQKHAFPQQVYTISTYAHRVAAYPKYSKFFTRTKEPNNQVMADFDSIEDAHELYNSLRAADIPAFKNYVY
jgi:hypothetical protein